MQSIKLPDIRHKVYIYMYIDVSSYSRWVRTFKVVVTICILNFALILLITVYVPGIYNITSILFSVFNSFTIFSVHAEN